MRRHDRWAEEEQPVPAFSEKRHASKAYRVHALVCARGTGKNTGVKREKGGPFEGPTAEAALAARAQWIDDFLHAPPKRSKKDMSAGTSASAEPREPLPRTAAPSSLKEEPLAPTQPQCSRPGPGRGHVSTPTMLEHELLLYIQNCFVRRLCTYTKLLCQTAL